MAGFFDQFSLGESLDPQLRQAGANMGSFMDDPQGRAALLSMGLALMQPPSFGDNPTSQIGRAIGAGGQSATANQAMNLKEDEAASKQDLRTAQAGAAETRAEAAMARIGTAGARADQAADRLGFQRERLAAMNERHTLGQRVRLSNMYQQYVKDTAKANANAKLIGGTEQPIVPMPDWIQQNPMLRTMGLVPQTAPAGAPGSEEDEEVPAAASTTPQASGTPRPGEVRKGYRFKGGDPGKPESWEKV